ncbi:MAG: prepilin-type N-terminal cleavage/methylation domain-containing protein [Comamonadaceae bacterium]|nr:MAG: prepilin-type N-terminal cleavage/methylation domain-containing protein [Comamonadaceae bacterium]
MRRLRGFTLVELLVALFAMALLAALSWRGLDGMMRTRAATEARADEVLTLQTGLAQWDADLNAIVQMPLATALDWNGRVLRLTRRSTTSPGDGVLVVGWARRDGQWRRWQAPPARTRAELDAAWQLADSWSQTAGEAERRQEVAIVPLEDWQLFYFRNDSWTNPLSSDASGGSAGEGAEADPQAGGQTPSRRAVGVLPDGVRLVLQLPAGRAIGGRLTRDWVRPTVGGQKS